MKNLRKILYFGMLVVFLLGCANPPAGSQPPTGNQSPPAQGQPQPGGDVDPGVILRLSASDDQPAAGDTITLLVEMTPKEDTPGVKLSLELPEQARLAEETALWQGDLKRGQPQTAEVKLQILDWPLEEPLKVTLSNNIAAYWAFWPPAGEEVQPSVTLSLAADPPSPMIGQPTRFIAVMTAAGEISAARGRFELPAEFQIDPGSSLEWQGDLLRGVPQSVEILATAGQTPAGTARFTLDLGTGETAFAELSFAEPAPQALPQRPQGLPVDETLASPPELQDEVLPPPPGDGLAPAGNNLPLADITVVVHPAAVDPALGAQPGAPLEAPVVVTTTVPTDLAPSLEATGAVGELALTVYLLANYDLTGGRWNIRLPDGVVLLAGALEWAGDLHSGDIIPLELSLDLSNAAHLSHLQVEFSSDQGNLAPYLYPLPTRAGSPVSEPDGLDAPQPDAPAGSFTLNGRFNYHEDLVTGRGILVARVEVWEEDSSGGDDFVCNTDTDIDGYWSCTGEATEGDGNVELYAIVYAKNVNYVKVVDSTGVEYRFRTTAATLPSSGGSHNFGTWWPASQDGHPQDGAFHIERMISYGWGTSHYAGGETPPFVTAKWPDPDGDDSSEYWGSVVYIEGPGSSDPDEWDDGVILHEYGHFLMDMQAILGSVDYCHDPGETPPCGHQFNSHEDPETAYIEGWANYYQFAAREYYGLDDPHIYFETGWSFNLENSWHSVTTGPWDDAESTTAGIMLDLNDTPNDDQNSDGVGDAINLSHSLLHNTFSNNPSGQGTPVDIHEFYTSFLNRFAHDNNLTRIFFEHGINKDSADPTGSLSINGGVVYATSTAASLTVSGSDPSPGTGVTQMRFMNAGGAWSAWETYNTSKSWTLTSSNGTKTVYVQLRDGAGNTSTSYSDSIVLDTVPPSNPTSIGSSSHSLSTWSRFANVSADWSGASDNFSGVQGYGLYWSTNPTASPGHALDTTTTSTTSPTLSDGNSWYLHLITQDYAGNWSSSAVHFGPFYIDTVAPTTTFQALPARSCSSFLLSWSASDPAPGSGVSAYMVQWRHGLVNWTNWLNNYTLTQALFGSVSPVVPIIGYTYAFRIAAVDRAGNWEVLQYDPEVWTGIDNCQYLPFTSR